MNLKNTVTIICLAGVLSACATDEALEEGLDVNQNIPAINVDNKGASGQGYNASTANVTGLELNQQSAYDNNLSAAEKLMQSSDFSDPSSPLSTRTIYFEYDSSQILDKFVPIVEAHASYLMRHPNQSLVLQGHSDERGTREYNISLGEQRAKSIFKMMQLLGVMASQINVVSYGEEKPIALEHNDAAFKLNRRVEMVYK